MRIDEMESDGRRMEKVRKTQVTKQVPTAVVKEKDGGEVLVVKLTEQARKLQARPESCQADAKGKREGRYTASDTTGTRYLGRLPELPELSREHVERGRSWEQTASKGGQDENTCRKRRRMGRVRIQTDGWVR